MKKIIAVVLSLVLACSVTIGVSAAGITAGQKQENPAVGASALFAEFDPTTLTDILDDLNIDVMFGNMNIGDILGTFDLASFIKGLNIDLGNLGSFGNLGNLSSLLGGGTNVGGSVVGAPAGVSSLADFDISSLLGGGDLSAINLADFDISAITDMLGGLDLGSMLGDFDISAITDMLGGLDLGSMLGSFDLSAITDMLGGFDISAITDLFGGLFGGGSSSGSTGSSSNSSSSSSTSAGSVASVANVNTGD